MSKRALEEYLSDPAVNGAELFADKQRLLLILKDVDFQTLSRFEKASVQARQFVQAHPELWRVLFQRDYPDVYYNVVEHGTNRMKDDIRNKIDMYTIAARKGNESTYWKRYYEFLVKTTREIHGYDTWWDSKVLARTMPIPRGWIYHENKNVDLTARNTIFKNPYGDILSLSWILKHDPRTSVFYFYPTEEDAISVENYERPDQTQPTSVIKIDMNTVTVSIVPWDDAIYDYNEIKTSPDTYMCGPDGFTWFRYIKRNVGNGQLRGFIESISPPKRKFLVSCSICGSTENLSKCVCCQEVYCGTECQRTTH